MGARRILRFATAIVLAVTMFGLPGLGVPPVAVRAASGEINGTVFLDYNDDGQQDANDPPMAGITVTAYDNGGSPINSTTTDNTTDALGNYTLLVPNGTVVRVEFTNLPVDLRPGAVGVDTRTGVLFVTSPVDNVDMGLTKPEAYCQDDPFLASPCYFNGDPLPVGSESGTANVLRSFPYSASGQNAALQKQLATGSQIGPTWALAYQRATKTLFAGALMKRHAGFGPLGTGGIYSLVIDPANGSLVSGPTSFLNLNSIGIPTGADPHSGLPTAIANTPNTDPNSWDAVGKTAIGDMDMAGDDQRIWVTNLSNQTLYSIFVGIPAVTPTSSSSAVGYSIVSAMQSVGGQAATCAASDVRPWAVAVHAGFVYVGVVCSAQSFAVPANSVNAVNALRAYILRRPDDTGASPFQLVYDFALNYPRGYASDSQTIPASWRPWIGTMTSTCHFDAVPNPDVCLLAYDKQIIYPQPILSDILFDDDGSIIVGLMDRAGHQTGNTNFATSADWGTVGNPVILYDDNAYPAFVTFTQTSYPNGKTFEGVAPGDVLRICVAAGVYTLESNGACGGVTTGGAGTGQGPGNGEFYYQDNFPINLTPTHNEIGVGGLVLLPGSGEVATSIFDPFSIVSGGVAWFNNGNGSNNRRYEILPQDATTRTFGKAAGLGDIEAFCFQPPIEIGNLVWHDVNTNGIQDPGEALLAGVTLDLLEGNAVVATAVTDANGNYIFSSALGTTTASRRYNLNLRPNTNYQVRIPFAQGVGQQPALAGLFLTGSDTDPSANGDSRDSDGQLLGVFAIRNITTGAAGDNNHTFDFGFSNSPPPPPRPPPPAASPSSTSGFFIPVTGFPQNRVTLLPAQPSNLSYSSLGEIWLEIPSLGIKSTIIGVPLSDGHWDTSWLYKEVGWLNGTAFPSWAGNSVLTAHVYTADGLAGPFLGIKKLTYDDTLVVHMGGQKYVFAVQETKLITAGNAGYAFKHLENGSYLTLITCELYNPLNKSYLFRRAVRAVLVKVESEK